MIREIHTTRNGQTVELRTLPSGSAQVRTDKFVNTYADASFARRVANILFMEAATGCYACALDKVGRDGLDRHPHNH
jgi:hypothetical protein